MVVLRDPKGIRPLCYRPGRPAVRRRQRERAAAEPRLQGHPVPRAGRDDRHPGRQGPPRAVRRRGSGRPTASSSGSTSPTSPARSTTAASTCRGRPSARSWPCRSCRRAACRSTTTRSSCRCRTPARRPPTRWPTPWACPSVEGLMRNRYVGRTFIEGENRGDRVQLKYTPLREVLQGKRVLLIEDTIVRSTTLQVAAAATCASAAGRRRSTSASPVRRSSRRASTASTCPRSRSCSPPSS